MDFGPMFNEPSVVDEAANHELHHYNHLQANPAFFDDASDRGRIVRIVLFSEDIFRCVRHFDVLLYNYKEIK